MLRFLFWNLGRRPLRQLVADVARIHSIDILILAECDISPAALLQAMNQGSSEYQLTRGLCESIRVVTKFHAGFLRPVYESKRISIRKLNLPGQQELLLAMAHLPSGLYFGTESRSLECVELAYAIREEERRAGHRRTVLVGDLNLNPFDEGVVAANGLNAVMTTRLAARGERTVQQRSDPFFYNPMWGCFGDRMNRAPGTYYYERAEHVNYYWNIFDQVLIRPGLLQIFHRDELRILSSVGEVSLVDDNEQPDSSRSSDHLPITFSVSPLLETANVE